MRHNSQKNYKKRGINIMKKMNLSIMAIALTLLLPSAAFATELDSVNNDQYNAVYSPATESLINGVPESQVIEQPSTRDVLVGPIFYSYTPNYKTRVAEFKEIALYSHDNTKNPNKYNMSVSVQKSSAQGSEFGGSISFTYEIKAGIFGGLESTLGGSYKETRSTNEAVGVVGGGDINPYKMGYVKFWYAGVQNGGLLKTYTYNTSDINKRYYKDTTINAKVYDSNILDVHSKAWSE
ncbi:hypothetical protein PMSD_17245 [Paenibacillus macquariensis subsp. defensor]|nr:hypothetical protein PMSD_17245 [Paenibacillus macquariensis subsp. defensor]